MLPWQAHHLVKAVISNPCHGAFVTNAAEFVPPVQVSSSSSRFRTSWRQERLSDARTVAIGLASAIAVRTISRCIGVTAPRRRRQSPAWLVAQQCRPIKENSGNVWDEFIREFDSELERYSELGTYKDLGKGEAEFCMSRGFDASRWRKHASFGRYGREIVGLFFGITTRRILPVVLSLGIFATLVELYNFVANKYPEFVEIELPVITFEITAPLLGLLLVFRTNSAYQRYAAGGKAMNRISGSLMDLVRILMLWSEDSKPRQRKDVDYIVELIVLYHTWICVGYLQPGRYFVQGKWTSDSAQIGQEEEASDSEIIPIDSVMEELGETEKQYLGKFAKKARGGEVILAELNKRLGRPPTSQLRPSLVQASISWEINRLPRLGMPQKSTMEMPMSNVSTQLAICENLLRVPIPLAYTRSLLRFLWLWLTLLPFALVKTFNDFNLGTWWEGKPLLVVPVVTCLVGVFFLSIDDIAVQIEEPFTSQRRQLENYADWFALDVAEMRTVVNHLQMTAALRAVPDWEAAVQAAVGPTKGEQRVPEEQQSVECNCDAADTAG